MFFRSGVLAKLEDMRDEALSKIMRKFQCAVRWYIAMLEYRRRWNQKYNRKPNATTIRALIYRMFTFRHAPVIIQRNIRAWCALHSWHWLKLYQRVKPLLKGNKQQEEEAAKLKARIKVF